MSDATPTPEQIKQAQIIHMMQRLMDEGRLVESGWMAFRSGMGPAPSPVQLRERRLAFWNGASFLFQALMHAMEPGPLETEPDLRRVARLDAELREFEAKIKANEGAPNFTCPRCGAISYNANDIKQSYCGACHDWTTDNG